MQQKKIIKINEGAATFDCKRKDQCFNPSSITIEKSMLIEFQNRDTDTHYIEGLDVNGESVFSTGVLTANEKNTINSQRLDIGAYYIYCKYHPWIQGAINVIEPDQDENSYSQTTIQLPVPKKIVESVTVTSSSLLFKKNSKCEFFANAFKTKSVLPEPLGSIVGTLKMKVPDWTVSEHACSLFTIIGLRPKLSES